MEIKKEDFIKFRIVNTFFYALPCSYFDDKITPEEVIKEVNGYPIKHDESFEIMEEKQYSTYSKKEKSEDRYAAGYFSIQFKNKWQQSFCPRVNTLVNNPFYGPFKTKMELDHYIKTENSKQG